MELEAPSIINEMKNIPIPLDLIDEIKEKKISQYIHMHDDDDEEDQGDDWD